jgi:uncharacterized membrane protein
MTQECDRGAARGQKLVLTAGIAMGVVELVATFVESLYAIVGVVLLFGGSLWLWRRPTSTWAVVFLGLLFLAEIVFLGDYNSSSDRVMIIITIVVCGVGLLGVVAWFLQRRRAHPAP